MNKLVFWLEIVPVLIFIISVGLAIFHNPLDIFFIIFCMVPMLIYNQVRTSKQRSKKE